MDLHKSACSSKPECDRKSLHLQLKSFLDKSVTQKSNIFIKILFNEFLFCSLKGLLWNISFQRAPQNLLPKGSLMIPFGASDDLCEDLGLVLDYDFSDRQICSGVTVVPHSRTWPKFHVDIHITTRNWQIHACCHVAAPMTSAGDLTVFYLDLDGVNDMLSHVDVLYFPFTLILIKFTRNGTS